MRRLILKQVIFISFILSVKIMSAQAHTLPSLGEIDVTTEPVVGYEWDHRKEPSPHVRGRVFYGVRLTAGYRFISLEAEYTRSNDEVFFPLLDLRIREIVDRLKLGIRIPYAWSSSFYTVLRLGGQASKTKTILIRKDSTLTQVGEPKVHPYVGVGLNYSLGRRVSLTADGVIVIENIHRLQESTYQATLGVSFSLGGPSDEFEEFEVDF